MPFWTAQVTFFVRDQNAATNTCQLITVGKVRVYEKNTPRDHSRCRNLIFECRELNVKAMQTLLVCAQGAFWGLMVGLVVGVCRMVLEFAFPPPRCGVEDSAPAVLRSVHYLHFAILLCGLTATVIVAVSLLTPPPTRDQVRTQKHNKTIGKGAGVHSTPLLCETPVTLSTKEQVICEATLGSTCLNKLHSEEKLF